MFCDCLRLTNHTLND